MNDETTLLPCPFCGGEAETTSNGRGQYTAGVRCKDTGCGCRLYIAFRSRAEAIAAWNTRAELGSERIAELEAENERLRRAGYEIGYHDAMKAAKRGGTLTAEQVREAAMSNSRQYKSPVDDGVWITEYDWQAIADKLNTTLGGGTCECREAVDR